MDDHSTYQSTQGSGPYGWRSGSFSAAVGGAQVLATGKSAGAAVDFKYALIGTALGVAISAGFLALKICLIRKQLFDNDSSDLKSTPVGHHETIMLKKRDQSPSLHSSAPPGSCTHLGCSSCSTLPPFLLLLTNGQMS
ncbi:hypothetical protein TREES_T100013712 [Tupaia chinensis]|uniref:Transmembrane protein 273 n=1 Tax=Tupaia chinensis TaxID=246437 RepID=L8Y4M7_TUPCH|nr:hypothetical protein TREES_T100013712 [Tupaia chinensis]